MIGILLALQVNNWNETRKLQNTEIRLIKNLKTDLLVTKQKINRSIAFNEITVVEFERIQYYIDNNLPYSDSLKNGFGRIGNWAGPSLVYTTYEAIKNKGFEIIQNDSIRYHMVDLYEFDFNMMVNDIEVVERMINQSIVLPLIAKEIRRYNNEGLRIARPNDFESLKSNTVFINTMSLVIRQRIMGIKFYNQTLDKIDRLLELIEIELAGKE